VGDLDNVFDPQETFTYTCVDNNVTEDYTNTANVIGFSIATGAKVEDEDPTDVVVIDPVPTCDASSFDLDNVRPGGVVTYTWDVNQDVLV